MLQGLEGSPPNPCGAAACKPDAPMAARPTEATILFIFLLACTTTFTPLPRVNLQCVKGNTPLVSNKSLIPSQWAHSRKKPSPSCNALRYPLTRPASLSFNL